LNIAQMIALWILAALLGFIAVIMIAINIKILFVPPCADELHRYNHTMRALMFAALCIFFVALFLYCRC
jgi:hypothetical protein